MGGSSLLTNYHSYKNVNIPMVEGHRSNICCILDIFCEFDYMSFNLNWFMREE